MYGLFKFLAGNLSSNCVINLSKVLLSTTDLLCLSAFHAEQSPMICKTLAAMQVTPTMEGIVG